MAVEDLLQKHNLVEAQINLLGSRVRQLNKRAQPYMKSLHPENQLLQQRLELLNKDFKKSAFSLFLVFLAVEPIVVSVLCIKLYTICCKFYMEMNIT